MKLPNYLYLSLSVLWLYSGLVPILFNQADSLAMLHRMHIGQGLDWLLLIGASLLDELYGILILTKLRQHAYLWLAQFITVALYSVIIVILLPNNSLITVLTHPFAPLIKNLPIMAILWCLFDWHKITNK